MEIGFSTDIGCHRTINQDSYFVSDDKKYPYFIIADGMGGKNAGEIASQEAINQISQYFNEISKNIGKGLSVEKTIEDVFNKANKFVYNLSLENSEYEGMGTTVVFAIQIDNILYVGNVGDSRLYCLSKDKAKQITKDHSIVAGLLEKGEISKEEAQNHPQKNIITRALGVSEKIEVDIFKHEIKCEDLFLMCTDGVSNKVRTDEMIEIVFQNISIKEKADKIVELANRKDGTDNATVVLYKLDLIQKGENK